MATTTNFGWETPDDTDLVKDGALAMRTLGNAIDTSLVDLKGGTTGQILSKTSNTDMDFTWINNDQGDITAVTAGTGISGGGTSGAVTITNSMATEITAAGDIIIGTGSGTFDNLPIGTTGQVLTADTTVSPYKVKWASAASGPTLTGVSLYTSTGFSISNNTYTIVDWDSEVFDSDSYHSTSTNPSRVTIPTGKSGKYQVTIRMPWGYSNAGYRRMAIKEDGTNIRIHPTSAWTIDTTSANTIVFSGVIDATAGKYYQVELYQTSGSTLGTFGGISWGEFTWIYLGA